VLVRLSKWVVVAILVISTGIHWMALQTVAWAGMIVCYSERAPLRTALAETFDGNHPCPLCKAIAKGKTKENQNASLWQLKRFEFPPSPAEVVLVAPSNFQLLPLRNLFAKSLPQQPLAPPPREYFV
jgi:hypothetical protein